MVVVAVASVVMVLSAVGVGVGGACVGGCADGAIGGSAHGPSKQGKVPARVEPTWSFKSLHAVRQTGAFLSSKSMPLMECARKDKLCVTPWVDGQFFGRTDGWLAG
eukprot:303633-Chlamydomonas_euryale.AAC.2